MINYLFPHGVIIVFLALFLLIVGSLFIGGAIWKYDTQNGSEVMPGTRISMVLGSLIVAYLTYHFIGALGS